MVGGGAPKSPFPTSVETFTVRLPLPTIPPRMRDPISELSFSFSKSYEHGYHSATDNWMYAAEYRADTQLGTVIFAAVVNAYSGKVEEAVIQIAKAYARRDSVLLAFENQRPPLPEPAILPVSPPLSLEASTVLDGTRRFRGFCAGLRSLDPALVDTVAVDVEMVFSTGAPPPPPMN
jgi:hypothetical protein